MKFPSFASCDCKRTLCSPLFLPLTSSSPNSHSAWTRSDQSLPKQAPNFGDSSRIHLLAILDPFYSRPSVFYLVLWLPVSSLTHAIAIPPLFRIFSDCCWAQASPNPLHLQPCFCCRLFIALLSPNWNKPRSCYLFAVVSAFPLYPSLYLSISRPHLAFETLCRSLPFCDGSRYKSSLFPPNS